MIRFEACSAFTRVTACALAEPPNGGPFAPECFSPRRYLRQPLRFTTGWNDSCQPGLPPAGVRCLRTAHNTDGLNAPPATPSATLCDPNSRAGWLSLPTGD